MHSYSEVCRYQQFGHHRNLNLGIERQLHPALARAMRVSSRNIA
jgi:hypothetical protein